MSSLFLNAPLTSVTLPSPSNSVHRILSSFDGLTIRPRLAAPASSSNLGRGGRSLGCKGAFFLGRACCHGLCHLDFVALFQNPRHEEPNVCLSSTIEEALRCGLVKTCVRSVCGVAGCWFRRYCEWAGRNGRHSAWLLRKFRTACDGTGARTNGSACMFCPWLVLSDLPLTLIIRRIFSLVQNRGDVRMCLATSRVLCDQDILVILVTLGGPSGSDRWPKLLWFSFAIPRMSTGQSKLLACSPSMVLARDLASLRIPLLFFIFYLRSSNTDIR